MITNLELWDNHKIPTGYKTQTTNNYQTVTTDFLAKAPACLSAALGSG